MENLVAQSPFFQRTILDQSPIVMAKIHPDNHHAQDKSVWSIMKKEAYTNSRSPFKRSMSPFSKPEGCSTYRQLHLKNSHGEEINDSHFD